MQCIESAKTTAPTSAISVLSMMGSNYYSKSLYASEYYSVEVSEGGYGCVWRRSNQSACGFVIYAFVVPSLAFFGLCANFINAIVFMRPKMTPSAFTYLAALAWMDCLSCLLITLTGLSRSFLYSSTFWLAYDFQWQTPLFGITTGAANLTLACVSLDRFIYLRWGIPNGTPKFCSRTVAKPMVAAATFIAIVMNLPYFFVFVVNNDGTFQATDFYFSRFYIFHNWFSFILLTLLPAIFLLIGNAAILIAFCKWTKQGKICNQRCPNASKANEKRFKHQMKLTVTIVTVITLYLVGELPAHLTSRKSAVNLLYGGDVSKVDFETMERLELICITLNALQLSMNIIVYAVINPTFVPEFFACLSEASDGCLRMAGITLLITSCGKICQKIKTKKLQTTATCDRSDDVLPRSDDAWQCGSNIMVQKNAEFGDSTKANGEMSSATLQGNGPLTFENAAFTKEMS